jgi:hypothetical protein
MTRLMQAERGLPFVDGLIGSKEHPRTGDAPTVRLGAFLRVRAVRRHLRPA